MLTHLKRDAIVTNIRIKEISMPITWNPPLVLLSILVAIFGSFTALIHVKRMRESTGRREAVWMISGGISLGLVIWAMHFIGMLAFHLPIPVSYDLKLTLFSGFPSVIAGILGFYLLRAEKMHLGRIGVGGLIMGLGIAAMHYTGMAALKMSPPIIYDPLIFTVSAGVAVLASYSAILVVYAGEKFQLNPLIYYGLGGLVMGLAISGMHYTAMAGTHFAVGSICLDGPSRINPILLTLFVLLCIFFLLGTGILASFFDRRFVRQASQDLAELQKLNGELEERTRKLNDSSARIHAILDTVVDGIITINERGTVEKLNSAAERIFGYTAAELIGRNINMLMPEPYHSEHDGYLQNFMTSGDKKIIGIGREVVGRRKDGATFPMDLAVSEMQLAGNRMFTGIVRDITERNQTNQARRENEARLAGILDNVLDGIITIGERGTVESFNKSAEKIFLYSADEVIGHNVNMLMPEPYQSEHDGYLRNFMTSGEKKIIGIGREVVGRRKDGTTFPMDLAVSEMQLSGRKMFTGIVRDITERKQMERMKSEFVSTVSHELRTPLTSIRGALGLVLGKFASGLPDKARQLLETANRNSERLTLLINDILDLEKIESGRLEFEFKALDLLAITHQAIIANEGYGQQHEVHLQLVDAPESAIVWGDEHRLLQVFANLISNAVKYSSPLGMVEVSVSRRDGHFRVSVRNYGRGIPAEFRNRIFQRFAQADSSDTREKGGTGLGLSITKAIVERHGGNIDFNSEEGACTEFFFDLPEWQEVIEQVPSEDTRPHMLICEDNPDVAMVLSELLEQEGVISDRVATATAALTMLKQKHYRGLLLDLGLPDMDGLTLIQKLRSDETTRNLPIIVVTGRTREDTKTWDGEALAVLDWLQKPIDRDCLSRALNHVMHNYSRPRILHVEDNIDVVQVTQALLEEDADYTYASSLAMARHELETNHFDLLLLDLTLPDGSGLELLDALSPDTKVIVFSGLDPNLALKQHVSATLTKATTSNKQLLATIKQVINQEKN
jgi:PAS domain S-box-containing protein